MRNNRVFVFRAMVKGILQTEQRFIYLLEEKYYQRNYGEKIPIEMLK